MDSGGEVYNPNGTPVSSSSGPGTSGSSASSGGSSESFTAQDLMDAITAGDAGKVIQLVSQTGTASPETQTVTMSAADLGLPSGGTVTLTVTGSGVNFSESRVADADGFVRFEVPKVETNSWVTIELSVQDSGGTIFWYGRDTQQVKDGGSLEVRIVRRFWTLPESLTVAVSPSAIAYNDTAPDSTSVTFSITNLSGAPDGAALSYSWKDETGAEVGTGATLTRTAGQMLGASFVPMNDSETRTYSVDVSYTDASGSTVTSSGSATATIATAATLTVNATGLQTEGDRYVLAVNKGTAVSFTAGVLCYGGTADYSWSPSGTAIGPVSGTGTHNENAGISPAAGGLSTLTVTATLADGRVLTKDIDVYVLDLTLSKGGTPLGASDPVFITDATGDTPSATLTAALDGLAGLSGVSYSWQVGSTSVATVSPAGSTPSATATVSSAAAGTTMVQVTASYKGVTTVPVSRPLCVVGLAVKESGTVLTGDLAMAKDAAAPTSLTAEVSGYGTGVSYGWTVTGSSVTASGTSGTGNSLTPVAGGKSTLTVTATITAGGMTLSRTIDVYIFDIALSASATLTPSTEFVDAWYPAPDITMTTEDTAGVGITASLNGTGMPEVEYEWQTSGADLPIELTGTGASCTVKPRATGMTTVKVRVKYGGANVAYRNIHITVAGLAISGSATHVWNAAASHTMSLTVAPVGITAVDSYTTSAYTSSDTDVATVTVTGGGTGITVTAKKGGAATITAKATYGGRPLTATKEIAILKLNVTDGTGASVPATGSILTTGATKALTAVLEGIPAADVEYEWTSSDSAKISLSPADEAATTLNSVDFGSSDITVTATYKETAVCTKTMAFDVALAVESLSEYLASLNPADYDADHPLVLPALAVTGDNWDDIDSALKANTGIYVDLSQTKIPVLRSLSYIFEDCTNLVKPPVLPGQISGTWASDGLDSAFSGCRNLTEAPVLPRLTKNMEDCFKDCRKLTKAPAIPSSVTSMKGCFYGCTNLSDLSAMTIPASCTNLGSCFDSCQNLVDLSTFVIPEGVRYMRYCFYYCQGLHVPPVIPASVTDMTSCFDSCYNLEGPVIIKANITDPDKWYAAFKYVPNVTVKVRSDAVKQAIEDSPGFANNVTIVVDPSLAE